MSFLYKIVNLFSLVIISIIRILLAAVKIVGFLILALRGMVITLVIYLFIIIKYPTLYIWRFASYIAIYIFKVAYYVIVSIINGAILLMQYIYIALRSIGLYFNDKAISLKGINKNTWKHLYYFFKEYSRLYYINTKIFIVSIYMQ